MSGPQLKGLTAKQMGMTRNQLRQSQMAKGDLSRPLPGKKIAIKRKPPEMVVGHNPPPKYDGNITESPLILSGDFEALEIPEWTR